MPDCLSLRTSSVTSLLRKSETSWRKLSSPSEKRKSTLLTSNCGLSGNKLWLSIEVNPHERLLARVESSTHQRIMKITRHIAFVVSPSASSGQACRTMNGYIMVYPPLTLRVWPVICPARSEAKKTMASAISWGFPNLRRG